MNLQQKLSQLTPHIRQGTKATAYTLAVSLVFIGVSKAIEEKGLHATYFLPQATVRVYDNRTEVRSFHNGFFSDYTLTDTGNDGVLDSVSWLSVVAPRQISLHKRLPTEIEQKAYEKLTGDIQCPQADLTNKQ